MILQLNAAGILMPLLETPTTARAKASYFIKRYPVEVTKKNYRDVLIPGDMAPKPIEELSILVEEVTITRLHQISFDSEIMRKQIFCLGLRADLVESQKS